jgi:hypothetical protein
MAARGEYVCISSCGHSARVQDAPGSRSHADRPIFFRGNSETVVVFPIPCAFCVDLLPFEREFEGLVPDPYVTSLPFIVRVVDLNAEKLESCSRRLVETAERSVSRHRLNGWREAWSGIENERASLTSMLITMQRLVPVQGVICHDWPSRRLLEASVSAAVRKVHTVSNLLCNLARMLSDDCIEDLVLQNFHFRVREARADEP